jgi:hypothetical protein
MNYLRSFSFRLEMIATILQATGVITIAIGAGLLFPPAGVILLGLGCLAFGIAMERGK